MMLSLAMHSSKLCYAQRYSAGLMDALVPVTIDSSGMLLHHGAVREYCTALQVSLSQVFAGMRQAQDQQLFTVLDWGVANAKLEEVPSILLLLQHHGYKIHVMHTVPLQAKATQCTESWSLIFNSLATCSQQRSSHWSSICAYCDHTMVGQMVCIRLAIEL